MGPIRASTIVAILAIIAIIAGLVVAPGAAFAQSERPLGRLEQESVDEALATLGLRRDPSPDGKVIGTIYVVNQEVFSRRDWRFQWFNIFHRTTRPDIIRRELLIKPGQLYDELLVEESVRNLIAPPSVVLATGTIFNPQELSSVVALVPVVSPRPGAVDLLAVTRDTWSLRFNTNFELQQQTLSKLETSLSENNLFGWRKYLAVLFDMDLGRYAVGPVYQDSNIVGTRLVLILEALAYIARDTGDVEGSSELLSLQYPLYSLASQWGAKLDVAHQNAVLRAFQGTSLAPEPVLRLPPHPPPPTVTVPYIFRRRYDIVDLNGTRSFGSYFIERVTAGYRFDDRSSELVSGFDYGAATPAELGEFLFQYAPLTERRSEPYLRYDFFTASYRVYRDLDTFDLQENVHLGPSLGLRVAYGSPALGADIEAVPLSATAGWAVGPGGALLRAAASGSLRLRPGQPPIDQIVQGKLTLASPMLGRAVRLVLAGEVDATRNDTQRTRFFLGGDTGMRGYVIGEFQGTSMAIGHVEVRSAPLALLSQRVGGLLFCDAGDAAPSLRALDIRVDVGIGLRWLIPQLNSSVIRVDWAVPLRDGVVTRAGFPGRASAGFQQIF